MTTTTFDTTHIAIGSDFDTRNRYLRTASVSAILYYLNTGNTMRFGGGAFGGYQTAWRYSNGPYSFGYEPAPAPVPSGSATPVSL